MLYYIRATMQIKKFSWLDREFVELSGETRRGSSVQAQSAELLRRFESEIKNHGLSLENCARITVFGRDRAARTAATLGRAEVFSGVNRVASSSFISAERFDSAGDAALELLVLRPRNGSTRREPVDFVPARNYLRFLRYDGVLFFSGFTSEAANLELQVSDVLKTLDDAFTAAGTSWSKVTKLTVFLQRDNDWRQVKDLIGTAGKPPIPALECRFVDGFAGENYLIEIEATALA